MAPLAPPFRTTALNVEQFMNPVKLGYIKLSGTSQKRDGIGSRLGNLGPKRDHFLFVLAVNLL